MERRLSAILAADVVGYSRLMGADEAGTLTALKAARNEVVDRKIAEHEGRFVKLTSDGIPSGSRVSYIRRSVMMYSCSGSPLMFVKGRTAMEGLSFSFAAIGALLGFSHRTS